MGCEFSKLWFWEEGSITKREKRYAGGMGAGGEESLGLALHVRDFVLVRVK